MMMKIVPAFMLRRSYAVPTLRTSKTVLATKLTPSDFDAAAKSVSSLYNNARFYASTALTRRRSLFDTTATKFPYKCSVFVATKEQRCVHSGPPENEPENQSQLNKRLPPLGNYPALIWPKFTNSIRNWFFTYFVIKPYFDKDFSIQEFMEGAHEAASLVSTKLSTGEFDDLEGLVEPSLLKELRQKISSFSVAQQDLLRVATHDIFFSFPYQIGIIIPDSTDGSKYMEPESGQKPPQTRHVEITVVMHVLRGMAEMQKNTKDTSFSIVDFTKDEENKYRVMVCNYRFFKDFTEGCKNPSWIINMVNHFLPAEIQR